MDLNKSIGEIARSLPNLGGLGATHPKIVKETEAEIAYDISEAFNKSNFRRDDSGFFYFDGKKYEKVHDKDIRKIILGVMRYLNIGKVYLFGSVPGIHSMIENDSRFERFEPSRSIISFRNKILNLSDMSVHAHDPKWMTRIYFDIDYDAKARHREWDEFLVRVIPDYGSRMILQEFLGLMFVNTAELSVEASMFLYGTGANGKSVVYSVIKGILGDYCSNFELSQLCSTNSDSGYYLALADGKLLNFATDMGKKEFSGGRYKAIAGREPVAVRPIGQAPFEAKDMPLLISNINEIPETTDPTNGYWRRFLIVKFPVTFSADEQDRTLKYKLTSEYSGIFNWIIAGRDRIIKNKGQFTQSREMEEFVREIKEESNSVLSFLRENNYVGVEPRGMKFERMRMFTRDLMDAYTSYCQTYGNKRKSKKNFMNDLRSAGFTYLANFNIGGSFSCGFEFFKIDPIYGNEVYTGGYDDVPEDKDSEEGTGRLLFDKDELSDLPF
jgi:P4 family phage/plasmid primase-like protien